MTREEFLKVFPSLIMNYQPAPDVVTHIGNVELLMIIGPSGVGKTTIINQLGLPYIPSDVTRGPRAGEKSGMDYYFRTDYDTILEEIKARRFVQTAVSPSGDFYATKSSSYPVYGTGVMAVVADVVPIFRRLGFSKTTSAFIVPPSYDEWLRRMTKHPMNDDLSAMRLAEARRSLEFSLSDPEVHMVLNDDLSKAVQQVRELMEGQVDRQQESLAKETAKVLLGSIKTDKMDSVAQQLEDKVKNYKMPLAAMELLTKHRPLMLAGTTGAGKDTIVESIQALGNEAKVITHTTRSPREGEKNGKDYWFVSNERMLELIEEESFIEVKQLHNQQVSGSSITSYQTIIDQGQKPILVIDVQGIEEIMNYVFGLKPVFMLPPNFETWMERLEGRGAMSHVERLRRMQSAKAELQKALMDDRFMLVINHDTKQAAKEVVDGRSDSPTQARNRELAQRLIDHIKAY